MVGGVIDTASVDVRRLCPCTISTGGSYGAIGGGGTSVCDFASTWWGRSIEGEDRMDEGGDGDPLRTVC